MQILYNENVSFCFSLNYIDLLESVLPDKDLFQAYVRELYDSNRIQIVKVSNKKSVDEELIEIAKNASYHNLVVLDSKDDLRTIIPSTINIKNASAIRSKVAVELLSKNVISVCYQDFKSNAEIEKFFEALFSIQREVKELFIFNREQEHNLLRQIKGKRIYYYTLLRDLRDYERRQIKKDLQAHFGGKLKLYWTFDKRIIHERKILYDSISITLDNALCNICKEEPTWEINVTLDRQKAQSWLTKKSKFKEVHD